MKTPLLHKKKQEWKHRARKSQWNWWDFKKATEWNQHGRKRALFKKMQQGDEQSEQEVLQDTQS